MPVITVSANSKLIGAGIISVKEVSLLILNPRVLIIVVAVVSATVVCNGCVIIREQELVCRIAIGTEPESDEESSSWAEVRPLKIRLSIEESTAISVDCWEVIGVKGLTIEGSSSTLW
jgi:hypothetical protein